MHHTVKTLLFNWKQEQNSFTLQQYVDLRGLVKMQYNSSILSQDIVWTSDWSSWELVIKLILLWIFTSISLIFFAIIWLYLNSKSPGNQSVMDIANKFFVECCILMRLLSMFCRSVQLKCPFFMYCCDGFFSCFGIVVINKLCL